MTTEESDSARKPEGARPSRVFLGWKGPFLIQVVRWMMATRQGGDFSDFLMVVPGRRGGRRLLEILAQQAPSRLSAFVPPDIVTIGTLPESLGIVPESAVAGEVDELLARVAALRAAPEEDIEVLWGRRSTDGRLEDWLDLAREIGSLEDELAGEDLDLAAVRARATLEEHEQRRWRALEDLGNSLEQRLRRRGLVTRNRARLDASPTAEARTVVLVGVADLGRLFRRLLSRSEVVSLVQAPAEEATAFDAWGCPRERVWGERRLDLSSAPGGSLLRVADRPSDQVREVVGFVEECCSQHLDGEHRLRAEEVAVGVGDPTTARAVAEALALAGLPAHSAFGRPFGRSRPARLLAALGRFAAGRRLEDLAALVRHPDVARFLARRPALSGDDRVAAGRDLADAFDAGDWPTVLDLYLSATLARRLGPEMPEQAPGTRLARFLGEPLLDLLPAGRRPLREWSAPLLAALEAIYGDLTLTLDDTVEAELGEALSLLADALREQVEGVSVVDDGELIFDGAQAVAFTLGRLAGASLGGSEGGGGEGVEILGWLELPLDDAPALVVTGLNEGVIPQSVNSDPFLPDRTRRALGLVHNRRRYARDLFHLTALVHARDELTLVAGRRSTDDEPLAPSRLLLACTEQELPARIRAFFRGSAPRIGSGGGAAVEAPWRGEPPRPEPLRSPITELPVTAFRDYLRCPYRFYLRHVLRLRSLRDHRRELDPGGFGSLTHEVLRRFGGIAPSSDRMRVERELRQLVETVARERLGAAPPPAVRVQLEQLQRRLAAFSSWQAEQVADGWTMERRYLEVPLRASLEVDGEPFVITGRIDRIDAHRAAGFRVLDYKTGERRRTPDQVHRSSAGEWTDLQLPLYALLARELGLEGRIELGFVHLSRELDESMLTVAEWSRDEIEESWEVARDVVRCVRHERFWPPSEPPPFDDGFGWICGDRLPASARGER